MKIFFTSNTMCDFMGCINKNNVHNSSYELRYSNNYFKMMYHHHNWSLLLDGNYNNKAK
jgi:hypothetical protein